MLSPTDIPPGYLKGIEVIRAQLRKLPGRPDFLMPPEGIWVAVACGDLRKRGIAKNAPAQAMLSKIDEDATVMMLLVALDMERIPFARAETLDVFMSACGYAGAQYQELSRGGRA